MADLRIEEYNVGDIGTNCYFIVNADTKEMVIIDPDENAEEGMPLMRNILLFPHVVQVILRKA